MKCSVGARRTWLLAMAGLTTLGASITVFAAPPTPANTASATSSAGPGPITAYMRKTRFPIPFNLDATGIRPAEVHLYVSRDGGGQWQLVSRQTPAARSFDYDTQEEGTFWFATRTIDTNGVAHPGGSMTPQLRITVDATRPTVEANADADGNGQLILDYNVQDISANEEGVRVEYMTDAGRAWLPCTNASRPISEATNNGLRGRMVWMPDAGWHHAFVRVFVRDRAGNETVLERRVERPRVAQNPIQLASNIPQQYQNRMASQASPNTTPGYIAPGPVPGFPAANPAAAVPAPALPVPTLPTPAQPAAPAAGYTPAPAASYAPTYSPAATPPVPPTAAPVPNIGAPNFAAQPMQGPGLGQGFATGPGVAPNQNLPPAQYNAGPTAPGMTAPNMPSAPAPGQGFGQGQAYVPGQLPPAGASAAPGQVGTGVPQFGPTSVQNGGAPFGTGAAPTPNTAGPSVGNLPFPAITGTSIPGTSSVPSPEAGDFPPMVGPGNAPPSSAPAAAATPRQQPLSASEAMRPLAPEEIQAEGSGQNPANNTFTSADSNGSGTNNVNVPDPAAAGISPELPPGEQVRPSRSKQFSLEYEVESVGARGVSDVELWGTRDGGRSWELWGTDPDKVTPFDIETSGEGVYGFRIVVVSGNGLASPRPLAGESADVYVLVDATAPTVRLTSAQYGEGDNEGSLVIRYACSDAQLSMRPISLSFSASPQGPWTTIAAGLPNTGEYVWPADPQLPRAIYLRVESTDQAGNVGTHMLDQPISVQGLAPRARIRGFTPPESGEALRSARRGM